MGGIDITSNSSALSATFLEYARLNQRDTADLFVGESRKFANELYMQTAAIAPSRAKIAADVKSRGWAVIKRGTPEQWTGQALQKRKQGRRGRPSARNMAADAAFLSKKPTLAQMQAYVIAKRSKARLYLASGWLGAISDLGGSLKITSGKVDRERGGADVFKSDSLVEVEFWNRTPGIVEQNAKHNIVGRAYAVRTADMLVYIQRKMAEQQRQTFGRAA